MPEAKRPLKVFLCHAHSDAAAVRALYSRLKREGVDVWLDKEKLLPGTDWELEIRKAVRESDIIIVCLSKQFNQAGFRQKEVRLALDTAMEQPEGDIFIIPLRLEECESLESLKKWHWVDLFEDDGYHKLIRALRSRAEKVGAALRTRRGRKPVETEPKKINLPPFVKENTTDEIIDTTASTKSEQAIEKEPRNGPSGEPKPRIEASKRSRTKTKRKPNAAIVVALIGLVGTIIVALLSSPMIQRWLFPTAAPTQTSPSPTSTVTLLSTSLSTEITDDKGVQMVLVPAGEFAMGSDLDSRAIIHTVYLDAFYIDKYEVTNVNYKFCADIGECNIPSSTNRYNNSTYADHPVVFVDWNRAERYCKWRGAQLPTEAQWEKAARGTDGRSYPWGLGLDCNKANYGDCIGDTIKVGSSETGISPFGAYDMAGNVAEWVADLYSESYYQNSSVSNPLGPDIGQQRVFRGGSWRYMAPHLLTTYNRFSAEPNLTVNHLGFRCARSVP